MPAGARTRGARTRGARTRLHGVRRRCAPQGAQRWRVQRRELGTASLRRQALHHEVRGARAQAGELLRGAEGRRRVVARGALIAEPRKERARRRREQVEAAHTQTPRLRFRRGDEGRTEPCSPPAGGDRQGAEQTNRPIALDADRPGEPTSTPTPEEAPISHDPEIGEEEVALGQELSKLLTWGNGHDLRFHLWLGRESTSADEPTGSDAHHARHGAHARRDAPAATHEAPSGARHDARQARRVTHATLHDGRPTRRGSHPNIPAARRASELRGFAFGRADEELDEILAEADPIRGYGTPEAEGDARAAIRIARLDLSDALVALLDAPPLLHRLAPRDHHREPGGLHRARELGARTVEANAVNGG